MIMGKLTFQGACVASLIFCALQLFWILYVLIPKQTITLEGFKKFVEFKKKKT
jgi:hypothetical protein